MARSLAIFPRLIRADESSAGQVEPKDIAALAALVREDSKLAERFVDELALELVPEWVIQIGEVRAFLERVERFLEGRLVDENVESYVAADGSEYQMRSDSRWELADVAGFLHELHDRLGFGISDLALVIAKDGFRWSAFPRKPGVQAAIDEFRGRRYGPRHLRPLGLDVPRPTTAINERSDERKQVESR